MVFTQIKNVFVSLLLCLLVCSPVLAASADCQRCSGKGVCSVCWGSGKDTGGDACYICSGKGRCYFCSGTGRW